MTFCHNLVPIYTFKSDFILSEVNGYSQESVAYWISKKDEVKKELINHQKSYALWTLKKGELINQWGEIEEKICELTGKPIDTIASTIKKEMKDMGIERGAVVYVDKILKQEWKNKEYSDLRKNEYLAENAADYPEADRNFTRLDTDDQIDQVKKQLEDAKQLLKKVKGKEKYLTEIKNVSKETIRGTKKQPKITQEETPKNMQKEGEMYRKIGEISDKCLEWHGMFEDIKEEVRVYPPNNNDDIVYAKGVDTFTKYIDNIFSFFKPLKDRKWTCGILKWFKIQQDNIDHGKHAAGKKAAVVIVDGIGKPILDNKGHEIKRFMTRERVGDNERPTYELATKYIESIVGMKDMESWLSKYQEGKRAARKYYKAPDFSEAAFGSDE